MKRRTALAALGAALAGCGGSGGDDAPTRTYALYGGSWSWGWLPDGQRMAVPPAVRLAQLLGAPVADYSIGAATLRQAWGVPVPFPDGRVLTADMLPHSAFPGHLHAHPADVVIFGYGASEPLLGTTREQFADFYNRTIDAARVGNCTPAVIGMYDHPHHPEFAEFSAIARGVAQAQGVRFIERRANWPARFVDDIHADQEQTDQWQRDTVAGLP